MKASSLWIWAAGLCASLNPWSQAIAAGLSKTIADESGKPMFGRTQAGWQEELGRAKLAVLSQLRSNNAGNNQRNAYRAKASPCRHESRELYK